MKRLVKRIGKQFRQGEKGFTLIEMLVVVAMLGFLAVVAVPNVSKFIGRGQTESYETELHNVQTAVTAMLADSTTHLLVPVTEATGDMSSVMTTDNTTPVLYLNDYMTGLDAAGNVKTGCTYKFAAQGTVTQTTP